MRWLALCLSLRPSPLWLVLACGLALPQAASAEAGEFDLSAPVQACEAALSPRWRPPVGRHLAAMPLLPRPGKGVPHIDRVHGSCILRITDHAREAPRGFAGSEAARRQSFNVDGTRLLVVAQDGQWHLYDARTLAYRSALPALGRDAEPQWHPQRPHLLYYLPKRGAGMQLLELDVQSGRTRVVADFTSRVKRLWPSARAVSTGGEGAPSADGRFWAFLVEDAARGGLGLFTWDLQEDRIIASYDLAAHHQDRPDHLSMSLSGQHVLVSWPDGPMALTRTLMQPRPLQGKGEHAELALTAEGDDVYLAVDPQSSGRPLFMLNLRTGQRTDLIPTQYGGMTTELQLSGRAHRRPGWVLVSTYADRGKGRRQWLHRRLMAVELKSSPRIVHLAFHRGRPAKQWSQPHATVNRDFSRVLFNSNWGTGSDTDVESYMVVFPHATLAR